LKLNKKINGLEKVGETNLSLNEILTAAVAAAVAAAANKQNVIERGKNDVRLGSKGQQRSNSSGDNNSLLPFDGGASIS